MDVKPDEPKHGVNWMELIKLVAPIVGGVAGGDPGHFMGGYMHQQNLIDEQRRQDAEREQKMAASGANFMLDVGQHAQGITDPVDYQNFLALAEHAGSTAGYTKPGELTTGMPFNTTKQHEAQLKELTDQIAQLEKGGYNLDELAASGASLHLKSGQALPIAAAQELLRQRPTDASGKAIPAPKKADTAASTDYGRFLAKFARDKGKTVDTLTTQEELAAKDQFAQAGRVPADPEIAGMNKTLKQLQIDAATQRNKDAAQGAGGGLTEEGIDYAATQYRVTGTMPALGMQSKGARTAVVNRAAQQAKALGQSPAMAIQKTAAFKSDAAALTQMRRMSSAAEAFETKALAQADLVDGLSAKVNRTQYPVINEALLAGRARILGDANTQLLFNALTTFTTEYAKIMEGSTGSAAGSSESARAAAAKLVSAGLSKGTLAQTLELMRKEMRLTIDGYGATIDHISNRMGGAPPAAPADPTTAPLTIGRFGVVVQ